MTSLSRVTIFLVAALLLLGCGKVLPGSIGKTASVSTTAPLFSHVFVLIGENHELSTINSTNAPFIMGTLKPESAWLTHYDAVGHPSEPNYAALTSGQYDSCETTDGVCRQTINNIFAQLTAKGISHKTWAESMPSNCDGKNAGGDSTFNAYAQRHNPQTIYQAFTGTDCGTTDVPAGTTAADNMSYFNDALAAGTVPRFSFVVPNLCQDGHDSCGGQNQVTEYNNFLKAEIPLIQKSPSFTAGSVIFSTYDEGSTSTGGGGNVMMAVTGNVVLKGTYTSTFNHYGLLRTIEQGFGLTLLNKASTATALTGMWG